jgi:AcrR family transcriptional regulator
VSAPAGTEIRERLLQAALRVFESLGSRGATTRRIAAEAGVNEITLFRHFGSKSALLDEALAQAGAARVDTGLPDEPADPAAELLSWTRATYAHLRGNAGMIRTTLAEMGEAPEAARVVGGPPVRVHEELRGYLRRLRDRGMMRPDGDVEAAAHLMMGTLFADAVARAVIPERYAFSTDEAPARYVALFLRAIGADGSSDPRGGADGDPSFGAPAAEMSGG